MEHLDVICTQGLVFPSPDGPGTRVVVVNGSSVATEMYESEILRMLSFFGRGV